MRQTSNSSAWWRLATAAVVALFCEAPLHAADAASPAEIRVAVYADDGAMKEGIANVQRCLADAEGVATKTIAADDIRRGALEAFDVVIFPGGSGSKQAKTLGKEGCEQVRRFVSDGGGYVGICAGVYLASAEYPWALRLLDAHVVDDAHWARGAGDVKLRLSPRGREAFGADESVTVYYEQGPLLAPGEKDDIADYELLAAYETEIAKNGAPQGVMKGTGAIARGEFNEGRVVCFSPHPEKTPAARSFVADAVRWAAGTREADGK